MLPRLFLMIFALLSLATAALGAPKNVVVIVADDLGCDLGCYGNTVIKTPHLDQIAADGTLFKSAFACVASCSPSRSTILSGMFNHANGQYGLAHGPHHFYSFDRINTLSARLNKAGYRTARIGKFHVEPESAYPFSQALNGNPRNGVQMANNCRDLIAAEDEKPFFLYFCTTDPHRSGKTGEGPLQPNLFGNEGKHPGVTEQTYDPQHVIVPPYLPDTPACRAELAEYYQSVSRLDQGVGRLVEILKQAGRWDDTLLIFASDNGVPFPGAKTTVYDPGIRLPSLVRNPYQKQRGIRSDAMVSWVDLAPTILEFAGQPHDGSDLHGRSFLSILDQTKPTGWDEINASHTFHEVTMYYPMRVVRTRQHKLIWNLAHPLPFPCASDLFRGATWQDALSKGPTTPYGQRTVGTYLQRPQFELYDMVADPNETVNLATDPAHAATFATLKEKLKQFQERTNDPWLHKWDYE